MKLLICDLDKTLLPYGGITLADDVKEKMIELEKAGIRIVLASARLAGGVFPIAKQLEMETYGGFVIADNGSFTYDMKLKKMIKGYEIPVHICDKILTYANEHQLHVSIEQGTYAIATGYDEGIAQDRENCHIDVILAHDVKAHIKHPIYKCLITESKALLDENFIELKSMLEKDFDVFRSVDVVIDILYKGCSKERAVAELLDHLHLSSSETAAIGDGNSDANMIRDAGLGVTLENGSELCKKYADMVVPSCYDNGCMVLFDHLLHLQK